MAGLRKPRKVRAETLNCRGTQETVTFRKTGVGGADQRHQVCPLLKQDATIGRVASLPEQELEHRRSKGKITLLQALLLPIGQFLAGNS